jgi:hypothetical protein
MQPKLALNAQYSYLIPFSAGITAMYHQAYFYSYFNP